MSEDRRPTGDELLGIERSAFAHPQWAVGMMLVLAVPFLVWGILGHPVWLLLGSPFIAVLVVWLTVRVMRWRRPPTRGVDAGTPGDL